MSEAVVLCVVYEPANENRLWKWEQTAKGTAGKTLQSYSEGKGLSGVSSGGCRRQRKENKWLMSHIVASRSWWYLGCCPHLP